MELRQTTETTLNILDCSASGYIEQIPRLIIIRCTQNFRFVTNHLKVVKMYVKNRFNFVKVDFFCYFLGN